MDAFTGYVYSAMWLVLGIYMFYLSFKHSKFFFVLSAFFLYSSVWYLCDELITGVDLFSGIYSWIYRGVSIVVLIACVIAYSKYRRSLSESENAEK